jgi:hypothetical protein
VLRSSLFLISSRSSRLRGKRYTSRSSAPQSCPSSRARTRIRSEKTSAASGAPFTSFRISSTRRNLLRAGKRNISRFLYDGTRINEDDTPASLDMEDNGQQPQSIHDLFFFLFRWLTRTFVPCGVPDTIDVMVERTSRFPASSLVCSFGL